MHMIFDRNKLKTPTCFGCSALLYIHKRGSSVQIVSQVSYLLGLVPFSDAQTLLRRTVDRWF